MLRTRCVVFDFDGVLVDSNAVKANAYVEACRDIPGSRPLVEAVVRRDIDGDRYDVIRLIVQSMDAAGLLPAPEEVMVSDLVERYSRICEDAVAAAPEMPGCSVMLERLSAGGSLYINSATPEVPLRRVVDRRGWRRFFKDVLGRPRTKIHNLQAILHREDISPSELVFVGDSPRDRSAAAACGCAFVAFVAASHQFDDPGPVTVARLSELWPLIEWDASDVRRS